MLHLGQSETWEKVSDFKLRELVHFWDKVAAVSCSNSQSVHLLSPPVTNPSAPGFSGAQGRSVNPAFHHVFTSSWPVYGMGPFPTYINPVAARVPTKKKKRRRGGNGR
ncbi:uncharacterized protein LOC129602737 [Paramacrobiotus metropolitanus]|uniref:uncharacterized protein LOC129602737 n=1 Tax=Paramacrobiotus metropolitanus TaxID=2943436 RepID=UPI0024463819|nr:uncharacterized protein LOC129602737 [Paramacrobiotus metropolitanus]